jgi:zinc protease
MKKLIVTVALAVLMAGNALAKVTLPEAEEITLDNGLTIVVIEKHNLPLFSFQMAFRAGSIYDPVGQEGLASLASDMLMRGTASRTAKQIADEVAFGGGTLNNYCDRVSAGFKGEFMTAQSKNAFEVLTDVVLNSSLTEDEFDKTKNRALGGLQGRREDAGSVADDGLFDAAVGESRYAHYSGGTVKAVEQLTRDDIVGFIDDYYTPDNCRLVICGDVTKDSIAGWMNEFFGGWSGRANITSADAPFPAITGKEVLIYDKIDATQTQIRLGVNGLSLNNQDSPAFEVARVIYGGSFTSRLMDEIRVNRGLSYGARCRSVEYQPGGLIYASTFTKNESVGEVVDIILNEAAAMQREAVPDDEFTGAVNYACGIYPMRFETNDHLVGVFSNMWLNGLDKAYYEDYQERLRAVSQDQEMAAAVKYFPRDDYMLILVGKSDEIKTQAEKFGRVTVIPLSVE